MLVLNHFCVHAMRPFLVRDDDHFWFVLMTISGSHDVSISGKGIGSKPPHFTPTVKTDECQTHSLDIKNPRHRNTLWDARTHRPEVFLRSDCAPKSLPRSLSMRNFIFRFCFFFSSQSSGRNDANFQVKRAKASRWRDTRIHLIVFVSLYHWVYLYR